MELLLDHRRDPIPVSIMDDRSHFGAKDPVDVRTFQKPIKGVDRLHQLDTVALVGESRVIPEGAGPVKSQLRAR